MPQQCLPPLTVSRIPNRAFTLIELLTVVAIIGVLAAILIPAVGRVRESARASRCASNLKSIGAAFQLYAAENRGLYPALRCRNDNIPPSEKNPSTKGWQIEISPYFGRSITTFNQLEDGADTHAYCPEFVQRYKDTPGYGSLNSAGYGMNSNLGVADIWDRRFPANRIVHPARTVLVGDSGDYHINVSSSWSPSATVPGGYASGDPERHRTGANYLFADGHVSRLAPAAALSALVNRPAN
jgi:prepilin-type N-terminal cleavage/methylation domain-containing protein/prepilin-type processing-associated H-X9-DG protein